MKSLYLRLSFILILVSLVSAKKNAPYERYTAAKRALYACNLQIRGTATFCVIPPTNYNAIYACYCNNPNAMATLSGCFHFQNRNTTSVYETAIKFCEEANATATPEQFEAAYENYTKYAKYPSEIPGFNISVPVDVPVKLNETVLELYSAAYLAFLGNYENSLYYGSGMLGFWLLVFIITAAFNWSRYLFPGFMNFFTGPISNTYRKYISLPALGRRKKTNEQKILKIFDCLVPTRLETMILVAFVGVTIACASNDIYTIDNNPVFPTKRQALLRLTADRTGIIATVIIPLLILFAGRNNFLMNVTMINFGTFIMYHRWVARIVFTLVFVHAVCFSLALGDYYKEDMKETYLIWGTIATVAGGIIMFQGMLFLRRRWYEVFLLTHIILAALFIGGAWVHVDELGYVWFYWATVAVWGFDRLVRIARLFWFGFPKADVILLADETLKVVVPKPKYWYSIPGGHAFIHFLRPSCFWQSHPFTFTESVEAKDKIILYCKVKGGVTHGLYQYLATHPGKTTKIRVALEGPYGEATAAKRANTAVFVAGGNGIPGIYSEIYDLAIRSPDNIKQRLRLVWIIREYKSLYWFYEELIALKNTKIETTIYVTKPNSMSCIDEFNHRLPLIDNEPRSPDAEINEIKDEERKELELEYKSETYKEKNSSCGSDEDEDYQQDFIRTVNQIKAELSHVEFKEGRPSMEEVVRHETEESNGSVAFVTCGHPVMVDDLRYSVAQHLEKAEGKRLDFYEQLQVWA